MVLDFVKTSGRSSFFGHLAKHGVMMRFPEFEAFLNDLTPEALVVALSSASDSEHRGGEQ